MELSNRFRFYKSLSNGMDLEILQGAGIAFILKILGAGASFGLQVMLARLLSLDDYGSYTYIMAWIGIISGFASLGFSTSLIRFIPEYLKKKEYAKLKGIIGTSILVTLACSVLFSVISLLVIFLIGGFGDKSGYSFRTFLYAAGILVGSAFTTLLSRLEKGKKNMFMAHAPSQLFKYLFIGSGVFYLWFFNEKINTQAALWCTLLSFLLLVAWLVVKLKKGIPGHVFDAKAVFRVGEWLKISLPLLLISGFLMILNRTDIIMLGILSPKAQVGIYNVAYKIATLVGFVLLAVNAIAAPTISELYHQDRMAELQQFARRIAHLIFWPTLLISGGLVLFSDFILSLFGNRFVGGETLLIILLVGQLVNACVGSVGYYLNMTGHQNDSARVFGVAALLNICFNPLGIYFFGAAGAAAVTTLTTSIWNIWLYVLVKRKVGVRSSIL